jgi:acyl carrier protein
MRVTNNSSLDRDNDKKKKALGARKKRVFDKQLLTVMKSIISKYTDRPELLDKIEYLPEDTNINFIKELNIDSVDVVEIVVDVEERFDITVTDEEIYSFQSFGDMYDLIELKLSKPFFPE